MSKSLLGATLMLALLSAMPPVSQAEVKPADVVVKSSNRSSAVTVHRSTKSVVAPVGRKQQNNTSAAKPRAASTVKEVRGEQMVDEGVIWALIRNEQYESAYATIEKTRKEKPGWKPSAKLLEVLANNHTDYLINQGRERKQWDRVIEANRRYPERFDCAHNYRRLALAEARVHLRQFSKASQEYRAILEQCAEPQRMEAMDHAALHLPATHYHRLLAAARKLHWSARGRARLAAAEVGQLLQGKPTAEELDKLTAREKELLATRDVGVANALAWANLEHGRTAHALELFRMSRGWKDNDEALKGEILALHRLQRPDEALTLIKEQQHRIKAHDMEKDVLPLQAAACGARKDYACQAEALERLATLRPLQLGEREALAWAHFQLRKYASAEHQFEALYRDQPNENHAEGLYLSLQRQGKEARARQLARELGGPLTKHLARLDKQYRSSEAAQYFGRKLFHSAQRADESYDNALPHLDTPFVRFGGMNRIRSGVGAQPMIHTLKLTKFYLEGGYFLDREQSLTAKVERVFIDAGSPLAEGLSIGTLPALPVLPQVPIAAIPTYLNGYEWDVEYQREGWQSYYLDLGQTFIGGGIKATWKGLLGTTRQYDRGFFGAEVYRQPIREKLLPYAGLLDPYTGQYWGRVTRNGVKVIGYHGLWDDIPATFDERTGFGVFYEAGAEVINGVGVKANSHYYAGLALPWTFDVDIPWGAKVSVAPLIRYEHYKQDQNHFTYGHGGYFSPQYSLTPGVNLHVESHESEVVNYMFNGFIGHHTHRHNASPVLPFTPGVPTIEGINYLGSIVQEWTWSVRAAAVTELSENWRLGGEVGYARSNDSQLGVPIQTKDLSYLIYLTWNLDARQDTLSSDRAAYGMRQRYGTQPLF
ncbi:MAG: hypothetical protein D6678_04755 [Zetaproteobacteria bacterium]|nr:MAG: hypothetical protein D6678_04755 [Zetaproteobacteria bacterium]